MSGVLVVSGDRVGTRMAGPGIRALEMARTLYQSGVSVTLAAPSEIDLALPFPAVAYDATGVQLREVADRADAIVLGGMVLARQPWLGACDAPLVVDVYGPYVLENLPAAAAGGASAGRRRRRHAGDVAALTMELLRGDFFLCASEKQRDFWLGALTALGRVNPDTYADDADLRRLIDVVPFGVPTGPAEAPRPAIKGVVPGIDAEDRVVLWSGGLWDWLDPQTLIRALAEVSRDRDDVKLYFMGARTPSADVPPMRALDQSRKLARELGLLDNSVFFHRDWVPYDDRAAYLLDAHVGASLHHPHIETRFAFRTRLLDNIWSSLPMLVTEGDVLAEQVAAHGVGRVVPPGDAGAVADALAALLAEPRNDPQREAAFARLREAYAWPHVLEPLVRFLAAPKRAQDQPAANQSAVNQSASGSTAAWLDAGRVGVGRAGVGRVGVGRVGVGRVGVGRAGVARVGAGLEPTPTTKLPSRALEALREGGPLLLAEELSRYLRWRRRSR